MQHCRRVALNERGYPIGEHHHNATVPDDTVRLIRDLREVYHLEIPAIARKVGVALTTCRAIVYYRRRAQVASSYRTEQIIDGTSEVD